MVDFFWNSGLGGYTAVYGIRPDAALAPFNISQSVAGEAIARHVESCAPIALEVHQLADIERNAVTCLTGTANKFETVKELARLGKTTVITLYKGYRPGTSANMYFKPGTPDNWNCWRT
jgi:hypothetical protein